MISITPSIHIEERELQFEYFRASGPGGQNVNKVATAVRLRFDAESSSLPEEVKLRLPSIAGNQYTSEGMILIEAKRFRTQEKNREDAIARLVRLIHKATLKPKKRVKTKPSPASKEKRLQEKKQRGEIKKSRRDIPYD
ncbi:MAG: aminoacyl-tRNA hydrolase [Anaerolineales bacterium]|nr:aminoacyl-tRNA hydrolase [Anaerolineae bacterium]PWB73172.1 MAG: aminoacyl-tRNA hydrolase [Anaerolineales bacterium]